MQRGGFVLALLAGLAVAGPAGAHPMPFSTLDVRLHDAGAALEVSLTAHAFDWAHDLGVQLPERLMEPAPRRPGGTRWPVYGPDG